MINYRYLLLPGLLLLQIEYCTGRETTVNHERSMGYSSAYTHEFFLSVGYNRCTYDFMDIGFRYYHWKNDGQTIMAFAGPCAGLEFNRRKLTETYVPYIGWQGQIMMVAYGIRAEYMMSTNYRSFGFTPEIGLSLFEMLRVTGGYRYCFQKSDVLNLSGFRFSLIAALPLSLLKKDGNK